ncbi:MAG TPA: serine/threonine-protein kinase [Kofleriaceae bacterium]|nr:serine/threonine-protein kinase [Kofleriaceae bacterium]
MVDDSPLGAAWSEPRWTGRVLAGRYELGAELGAGAMGTVYSAMDLRMDRACAVKLMMRGAARARDWFAREAKVAASVNHPGVLRILDYGEADGVPYLVSERLTGEPFDERLRRGVSTRRALEILGATATAMAHCHRLGLVHRDLKPSNVYLDLRDGIERAVVLDFGLAFQRDAEGTALGRLTGDGMICGTPAYMSPEQCQATEIGQASDVYSLGCVLFESLSGRLPFDGSAAEILTAHAFAQPPRLRHVVPEVTPALDELVHSMMTKTAAGRPTMAEVAADLTALAAAASVSDLARGTVSGTSPTWSSPQLGEPQPVVFAQRLPLAGAGTGALGTVAIVGAIDDPVVLALGAAAHPRVHRHRLAGGATSGVHRAHSHRGAAAIGDHAGATFVHRDHRLRAPELRGRAAAIHPHGRAGLRQPVLERASLQHRLARRLLGARRLGAGPEDHHHGVVAQVQAGRILERDLRAGLRARADAPGGKQRHPHLRLVPEAGGGRPHLHATPRRGQACVGSAGGAWQLEHGARRQRVRLLAELRVEAVDDGVGSPIRELTAGDADASVAGAHDVVPQLFGGGGPCAGDERRRGE